MKRIFFILPLLVFAISLTSNAFSAADGLPGNLNILIGKKTLDEDDWGPADSQYELGVDIDFKKTTWPIYVDIACFYLKDIEDISDGESILTTTWEFRLGAKYIWDFSQIMHPYIAGGVSHIKVNMKTGTNLGPTPWHLHGSSYDINDSDDDSANGYYFTGGFYWRFGERINLGAEFGYSSATATLFGVDIEAGGTHALVVIGLHYR